MFKYSAKVNGRTVTSLQSWVGVAPQGSKLGGHVAPTAPPPLTVPAPMYFITNIDSRNLHSAMLV